ncbi:MAG TPA: DoxX family protein [Xanthomonadales bacterium]|nr:DoxX family protein [Xanthomonadales bacterium]
MSFKSLMSTNAGWGMAIMRVVTGIVFMGHGAPKFGLVGDRNLAGTAEFLGTLGVPAPMVAAFLVAFFELAGGALLVVGFLTRIWAAGLAFAMLIAVTMVHLSSGMFGQGGYQWALLLMACSLALMIDGAGRASLDRKLSI